MKKAALFLGLIATIVLSGCASQKSADNSATTAQAQPAPAKKDLKGESI